MSDERVMRLDEAIQRVLRMARSYTDDNLVYSEDFQAIELVEECRKLSLINHGGLT
jgi:hypothetical protein